MAEMTNDVHKLKGIGPKYTQMLEGVGVDSIKELRHRVPENLFETIEKKHGKVVGLSLAEVGGWITEAKAFKD
jgi:hypothetical protein